MVVYVNYFWSSLKLLVEYWVYIRQGIITAL